MQKIVNGLEDRVMLQWKLEFEKECFDSSSAMLKEFLDVCVHQKEAEMHKPLAKKIACTKKEHDKESRDRKGKHNGTSELHHKRHHGLGKCHAGK
eukprot:2339134-Ditylum_brightwellii.AAC.1